MKELKFYNKHFEKAVRDELLIYDRPLTEDDALLALDLDCTFFNFSVEDVDTLCAFKNLEWLKIYIETEDFSFLGKLVNLEELRIYAFLDSYVDLSYLAPLQKLKSLEIFGGYGETTFDFRNFDTLAKLPCLENLSIGEFGTVDLSVLNQMPNLKGFYCAYAGEVCNVDAISNLVNLTGLTLIDITLSNLDFIKTLPNKMKLSMSDITFLEKVDFTELYRFEEKDIDFM